jgi:hypothetical protein
MILSALSWRKKNGAIIMACDGNVAEYLYRTGVSAVWDYIETIIPNDMEGINPLMFWAGAKLIALREISAPLAMIDLDFIVWKKLKFGEAIIAAHREDLYYDVYPPLSYFQMKNGYTFRRDYNEDVLPLNTAFLYLPEEDFKQYYVNMSIEFMKSAKDTDDFLCYMVFAEQRLLAILADLLKQQTEVLLDKDKLFLPQDSFTHLWGAKRIMRGDKSEEDKFCKRCADRIKNEYPNYSYVIDIIDKL